MFELVAAALTSVHKDHLVLASNAQWPCRDIVSYVSRSKFLLTPITDEQMDKQMDKHNLYKHENHFMKDEEITRDGGVKST